MYTDMRRTSYRRKVLSPFCLVAYDTGEPAVLDSPERIQKATEMARLGNPLMGFLIKYPLRDLGKFIAERPKRAIRTVRRTIRVLPLRPLRPGRPRAPGLPFFPGRPFLPGAPGRPLYPLYPG